MAFPVADPTTFNPLVAGERHGHGIAYDQLHDALFSTAAEYHQRASCANDRSTATVCDVGAGRFLSPLARPGSHASARNGGFRHAATRRASLPGRNRIYLADFMQGR
jgi:hypothetical protein